MFRFDTPDNSSRSAKKVGEMKLLGHTFAASHLDLAATFVIEFDLGAVTVKPRG